MTWSQYATPDNPAPLRQAALAEKPDDADLACPAWRAWHQLKNDRHHAIEGCGGGLGAIRIVSRPLPIPWAVVKDWAESNNLAGSDREELFILVQALDAVFLEWRNGEITRDLRKSLTR